MGDNPAFVNTKYLCSRNRDALRDVHEMLWKDIMMLLCDVASITGKICFTGWTLTLFTVWQPCPESLISESRRKIHRREWFCMFQYTFLLKKARS